MATVSGHLFYTRRSESNSGKKTKKYFQIRMGINVFLFVWRKSHWTFSLLLLWNCTLHQQEIIIKTGIVSPNRKTYSETNGRKSKWWNDMPLEWEKLYHWAWIITALEHLTISHSQLSHLPTEDQWSTSDWLFKETIWTLKNNALL